MQGSGQEGKSKRAALTKNGSLQENGCTDLHAVCERVVAPLMRSCPNIFVNLGHLYENVILEACNREVSIGTAQQATYL